MRLLRRIASRALMRLSERRLEQLRQRTADPMRWQRRLLAAFVRQARDTVWGREHRLDRVDSPTALRREIPLGDYESFHPYWQRSMRGEPNVCWPGVTQFFGITSGTSSATGATKHIPLTRDVIRCTRAGARDCVAAYVAEAGDRDLLEGKYLFLGGATVFEERENQFDRRRPIHVGDNTGVMAKRIPRWLRPFYLPGPEIARLDDWEEKLDRIARLSVGEDVRLLSGLPSWTVILLNRVLAYAGANTIAEVWPDLRCYIAGGVAYTPYRALLERLWGRPVRVVDNYGVTEGGIMAVQDRGAHEDMLVIPDLGAFMEFIALDDLGSERPPSATLDTVEPGVDYAIAVTTNGGMFRYVIGDTVRFTSVRPPRLVVSGRLTTYMSFFGEHVCQRQLEGAIAHACRHTGANVTDFVVTPCFPTETQPVPGHRWLVEFARGAEPTDRARFTELLDDAIASPAHANNERYATRRVGDTGLKRPELVVVPAGTFYAWMKRRQKLGGQNKIPRVIADSELIASLTQAIDDPAPLPLGAALGA